MSLKAVVGTTFLQPMPHFKPFHKINYTYKSSLCRTVLIPNKASVYFHIFYIISWASSLRDFVIRKLTMLLCSENRNRKNQKKFSLDTGLQQFVMRTYLSKFSVYSLCLLTASNKNVTCDVRFLFHHRTFPWGKVLFVISYNNTSGGPQETCMVLTTITFNPSKMCDKWPN